MQADIFDGSAIEAALRNSGAETVIDQLTSLPADPANYAEYFPGDRRLRLEGGGTLHRAARRDSIRRYIQQSSGFFLKPQLGVLATEEDSLAVDASPGIAASAQMYAAIERRLEDSGEMQAVGLRYGFFYGPGTWYSPEGAAATHARNRRMPIIGEGSGVWSFIHVEDAVRVTAMALLCPPGIYNIVDDQPSPQSVWLPAFARFVGAPAPPVISMKDAIESGNLDGLYYATRLAGASNAKARTVLSLRPRILEWLAEMKIPS